ncbi:MAG: DUF4097 domain-containing protein [Lachnospiraceae bacterium]|nr:DUF4097 domain-containing protein [Lachnospiraceae bacterium]
MKKSIYLTVIWIITIFCIIGGSCYRFMGWGQDFFERFETGSSRSGKISDQETLDEFHNISFDIDLSEVTIEVGNSYHISYHCTKNQVVEYKVENDTLTVTETSKNPNFPKRNGNDGCDIVITVPRDTRLTDVSGSCDLGDVEISGLTADKVEISCDLGEASVSNVTAASIICTCNLGNCEIEDCIFDDLTVSNDLGNVDLSSNRSISDYTLDLQVSLGSIEINDDVYYSQYRRDGDSDKNIKITCSLGSIEIDDD